MNQTVNLVKKFLSLFGLEGKKAGIGTRGSLTGVLNNLKTNGFEPGSVIDVGAAFGSWSSTCIKIFPDAQYLLIEPLVEYEPALTKTVAEIKNAEYVLQGLFNKTSSKTLYLHQDLVGSSLKQENESHNQNRTKQRTVPCVTLDDLVQTKDLRFPSLIKLDVQGSELEVISGAQTMLTRTEVLIMEVSLIECISEAPMFAEVIEQLKNTGFVVYDIFGHNYRPYDTALAQVDIVFIQESSPLRAVKWYADKNQRIEMNRKFKEQLKQKNVWIP